MEVRTYEDYKASAAYILDKIDFKPELALILGSNLGGLAKEIDNPTVINYEDIPNFLETTVESHAGKLILGDLAGKKVVCMSGRFHYYEGYSFEDLAIPVRIFYLLGVKQLILTNAAGGVNKDYRPGDLMVIKDHIKLAQGSPVRGKNIEAFGPRFFDMSTTYPEKYRQLVKELAEKKNIRLHEGVYFYMSGPQFETPAEIELIHRLGGDAVGMSTVTEAITASQCGIDVIGISLISNMAAGILEQPVTVEEVDEVASVTEETFRSLIKELVEKI